MKNQTAPADEPATETAPGASAAPDELDQLAAGASEFDPAPLAPAAPDEPDIPTKVLVSMVLGPGFSLLAPNWNISASEVEHLSEAYAAVLDKYFPDGLGKFGPEIGAAVITLAVFGPRLNKPRKLEDKKPDTAPAASDAGAH